MVAEPIKDIIHLVDDEQLNVQDIPRVFRIIQGGLANDAVADTGIELATDAGFTIAAIIDAVFSLVAAIIIAIILVAVVLFLIFYNQIRAFTRSLPLVGQWMVQPLDALHHSLLALATWIENEAHSAWNGLILKIHTVVSGLISILGLPSLTYVQNSIAQANSKLARIPYEVDALENRVMKALVDTLGSLWENIHQIWHWIHVALAHIANLTKSVHELWDWIHHLLRQITTVTHLVHYALHQISKVWKQVHELQKNVNNLQKQVKELEKETGTLKKRLTSDENKLVPAIEAATVLALLAPLIRTGPEGIANLAKLADDPCMCFNVPTGEGFLANAALAYLLWKDDP